MVLQNVSFSNHHLSDMYKQRTPPDKSLQNLACEFLISNEAAVDRWVPQSASQKSQLYIGGFFPLNEDGAWWEPSLVPGMSVLNITIRLFF